MKLMKPKAETAAEAAPATTGGATIAARFQLDQSELNKPKVVGVNKTATLVALICALAALGALGFAAWMMYSDWTMASVA